MKNLAKWTGMGLCALAVTVGCSAGAKGGDTSCGEFKAMSTQDQTAAVTAMLKDDKGKEASNLEITGTRLSAVAFCKTLGKDSSKIRDIKTG